MLHSGSSAIVNMASTGGLEAIGGSPSYVSAKHDVTGADARCCRGLRRAQHPRQRRRTRADPDRQRRGEQCQVGMTLSLLRIGQPLEVAKAVFWLCLDQASFITGTTDTACARSAPYYDAGFISFRRLRSSTSSPRVA
jgi:NAD(P)-dependent dehydrogenase (short-subunit alcohol dehydrogenase family)